MQDKELERIFNNVINAPTIQRLLKNGKTKEAARGSVLLALLEIENIVLQKKLEQEIKQTQTKG